VYTMLMLAMHRYHNRRIDEIISNAALWLRPLSISIKVATQDAHASTH
jgi:hypothetical protein